MAAPPTDPNAQALQQAIERLLQPLARLAVARGLPYAAVDEMLRQAFVAAAHEAHPGLPEHRRISRISAATGLNRREVGRLQAQRQQPAGQGAPAASRASEVFARWRSEPRYRGPDGRPRPLPRTGPEPSFESLAAALTRDVHPRSLLEELLRLRLAELDGGRDEVRLLEDAFVPREDAARMAQFLGANVGDHFDAAVDNLLGAGVRHFEQALFADGLSQDSVEAFKPMVLAQWRQLTDALVPALQQLVDADEARAGQAKRRLRLGLYAYDCADPPANQPADPPADAPADPLADPLADPPADPPAGEAAPQAATRTPAPAGAGAGPSPRRTTKTARGTRR